MDRVNLVEWTDLLFHAEKLGFSWNYAHELLRAFQGNNETKTICCEEIDEIIPMEAEYIYSFEEEHSKDGDLNQMGRDIVYDFMQMHKVKEMVID